MYDVFSLKDFTFPKDFVWGSGYAGHQVEGNNTNNQWWEMEQEGKTRHKSGLACNSYELYQKDIDLAHSLGHQVFRTSVEWCRIEPEEGVFNNEAAEHYVKLFSGLKEKGIKVFATMVHVTHPLWFHKKGHFEKIENLGCFERYLEYIVPKIAPYVDYWNVINEFNLGNDKSRVDYKLNSVIYHARGYHIIKKYSDAPVSSAHALVQYQPYRPMDKWDIAMTEFQDLRNHEFFFHAIRTGEILYPERDGKFVPEVKNSVDFWSINCYVRDMIDARKARFNGKRYDHKELKMIDANFYLEEMFPECMIANMSRLTDKPVIISENGCSCNDDRFRIVYLALYLSALAEAIKMGADVKGYLYWSLMDNFEWGSYLPRFGLCDCNFETFERTPKPSAYFFKEIIENNGFNQQILRKYLTELPSLGK
ncbi:MAG: glycoside hydrolase family 1 protein [Clostridia bacterium]|nr:glycoside hydrolase family 1 protein [Clostridia bacterium]